MDCGILESLIRDRLKGCCKASRVEHCLSVAALSAKLCRRFGIDEQKGSICGLAHDILKDSPLQDQWGAARRAASIPGFDRLAAIVARIEDEKAFADKIIHGPAAAVYMHEEFRLDDMEMLEAIALHSSAASAMSPLAKIVYVSDKMEPRRPFVTAAELAMTDALDLDALLVKSLGISIDWLRGKGSAIAQSTLDLYNALTMRESTS